MSFRLSKHIGRWQCILELQNLQQRSRRTKDGFLSIKSLLRKYYQETKVDLKLIMSGYSSLGTLAADESFKTVTCKENCIHIALVRPWMASFWIPESWSMDRMIGQAINVLNVNSVRCMQQTNWTQLMVSIVNFQTNASLAFVTVCWCWLVQADSNRARARKKRNIGVCLKFPLQSDL